jgi:F0F1-type ATP synthase delta subunit
MKHLYAKAISKLQAEGKNEDELVSNLVTHLKARGRTKLLPGILQELKTLQARKASSEGVLEVAHQSDKASALAAAKAEGLEVKDAHVNHSLLSGWRARSNGQLIDRSGKRALVDLYNRIVN